ncbi:MAG: hypothetical protein KAG61_14055 [Bacteriovoracaceae bacterium]|nr:hypothetical protein [Bacteriovoracaceae bacterium]
MKHLHFTEHAMERIRQRGFSSELVELLYLFGEWHHAKEGGFRIRLTHKLINILIKSKKVTADIKQKLKANMDRLVHKVLVVEGDTLVTVFNC